MRDADLSGAFMSGAYLGCVSNKGSSQPTNPPNSSMTLGTGEEVQCTDLAGADLAGISLAGADLSGANLEGAKGVNDELLWSLQHQAASLEGATMPNGQKYEEWVKDREDQEMDGA